MVAVLSLLIVLTFSLLIVRIATVALTLTGLSSESAGFQARSAFTGTGFTTRESEAVVNHPLRRRIVMLLMILRNAGIITAVSSLILSFVNLGGAEEGLTRLFWILAGVTRRKGREGEHAHQDAVQEHQQIKKQQKKIEK